MGTEPQADMKESPAMTEQRDTQTEGCAPYQHILADAQKLLLNNSTNNKQKTKGKQDDNNDVSGLVFAQAWHLHKMVVVADTPLLVNVLGR